MLKKCLFTPFDLTSCLKVTLIIITALCIQQQPNKRCKISRMKDTVFLKVQRLGSIRLCFTPWAGTSQALCMSFRWQTIPSQVMATPELQCRVSAFWAPLWSYLDAMFPYWMQLVARVQVNFITDCHGSVQEQGISKWLRHSSQEKSKKEVWLQHWEQRCLFSCLEWE